MDKIKTVVILASLVAVSAVIGLLVINQRLNTRIEKLEAFQIKVDSTYIPNLNATLINSRHIDIWFEKTLFSIDSTTTNKQRLETIELIKKQQQNNK